MASLAEIRAKLKSQEVNRSTSSTGGDNAIYPHWNIAEGSEAVLRFLPDKDTTNTFFWTERNMIKLPFADEEDRQAKLKALQDLQMDPKTSKDPEMQAEIQKRKRELEMQKEENQLEGLTFEDIKPYVSMYTDKDGKKVNAVLDKDGEEVFKTHDAKAAMAYLAQNYDKLKKEDNAPDMVIRDPDDEAEDKEQEIAKDQEEAEKINTELDRIKQLANI